MTASHKLALVPVSELRGASMAAAFTPEEAAAFLRGDVSPKETDAEADAPPELGSLGALTVMAPRLRRRLNVSFVVCRAWRTDRRSAAIDAMKEQKKAPSAEFVTAVGCELAAVAASIFGPSAFASVSSIACGHSRTPECMGKQIAVAVAAALGIQYRKVFNDRFVAGSSHPKAFADLPPLTWNADPIGSTLLVDDVATSGWHLKEAMDLIRGRDFAASAVAWVGGDLRV